MKRETEIKGLKIAVVTILRLGLGLFFIVFGFMRAVNPVGGSYMIEKEMAATGLDFFMPASFILALLSAAIEFGLGVGILLGTNIRSNSIFCVLLLLILTPINFYTAYFSDAAQNNTYDEAFWLENGVSCWIYLLFLIIASVIFYLREYSYSPFTRRTEWSVVLYSMAFSMLMSVYSYLKLPFIDIGPYRTGTNIARYESKERDKEITLTEGSICKISNREKVKTKDGSVTTAIHFHDKFKGDQTDTILHKKGYTFLLVAEDLSKTSTSKRFEINSLYEYAKENGYGFYCLTATIPDSTQAEEYIVESDGAEYPIVNADQQVLRAMIKSNPGLILLKNGVIYQKWSNWQIKELHKPLDQIEEGQMRVISMHKRIAEAIFTFGLGLAVILAIDWICGLLMWTFGKIWSKIRGRKKQRTREEKDGESNLAIKNVTTQNT